MTEDMQAGNSDQPTRVPRRRLLGWLWTGLGLLAALELGWLTATIVRFKKGLGQADGGRRLIDAGLVESLQPGQVRAIPEVMLYLSRLEDGSFIALSKTCTHLGCALPWDEAQRKFVCPCHGSTFAGNGTVLTAPATRPLDYYPLRIENGQIRIDASSPIRREAFDPAQAARV